MAHACAEAQPGSRADLREKPRRPLTSTVTSHVEVELDQVGDTRQDYGEARIICYGYLAGRIVVVGYTPRGADRHIFSMRKANDREKARIAPLLEV